MGEITDNPILAKLCGPKSEFMKALAEHLYSEAQRPSFFTQFIEQKEEKRRG